MSEKKKLMWNSFIYTFKSILGILFPMITFPYVSRVLGPENIGRVEYANSVSNYFIFLAALGITTYGVRTGAQIAQDRKALSKFATEMFIINVISTIVAYIAFFIVCRINVLSNYGLLIFINSLIIVCNTIGMEWVFNVMEDFTYITVRYIIVNLFAIAFLFVFVKKPEDYIWYSVYILIANGSSGVVNAFALRRYVDLFVTKITELELKKHIKPIFLLFSISIVSVIYANLDTTMLGRLRGNVEVGLFQSGMKIDKIVMSILAAISTVMFARISSMSTQSQRLEYEKLISDFNGILMLVAAPLSFGLSCISISLTNVLLSEEYQKSGIVLMIISLNVLSSAFGRVYGHQILLTQKKDKEYFWVTLGSLFINVIINVLFIPSLGCIATAISTVIANIFSGVLCVCLSAKLINIKPMIMTAAKYILISAVFFVIEYGLNTILGENMLKMCLTIIVCALYYLGMLLLLKDRYILSVMKMLRFKKRGSRV